MAKNRRRQLREFLARHPICIFCGGQTLATTRDHVPSRQMFRTREWPEHHDFPACESCNTITKDAEQVMALIARVAITPKSKTEAIEFAEIVRAVRNNYPAVIQEMKASPEQIISYQSKPWFSELAQAGIAAPEPLSVRGPLVKRYAETFARKLFTALHYREFGKIVPREGAIIWRWYTNTEKLDGRLPDELTNLMTTRPTIKRARNDLTDQFAYTYVKVEDDELTGYFAMFREAFAMLGFVDMDAERLQRDLPPLEMLRPLDSANADLSDNHPHFE